MPLDDFLSPDLTVDPLDVSGLGGTPPFVPAQQSNRPNFKQYAPLLAILPFVAKSGGLPAIGALLRGMQQGRIRRQQEGRQGAQDERMAAQEQRLNSQQQTTAKNAELQRRQQFMGQFSSALGGVDSPEAVQALIDFYGGQAESFGMARPDLERFAMQSATPDTLMTRKVSKRWEKMGIEARELAQKTKASLQIDGQTIPYATWAPLVGGMVDPATGGYPVAPPSPVAAKPVTPPTPGSFEEYIGLPADQQALRLQQRKAFNQADDRPSAQADPRLAEIQREIAQARLENLRAPKDTTSLPPAVSRRVDVKARGWDSLPIVKSTQVIAEAATFVNSLDINTKNPADDQSLIYAFAKAQDPESVVREGEYATVQKYAQSWANTFGFNAARIFSNTPFLTPQARQNMKQNIMAKFASRKVQYDNVRRSYASQINRITGQGDGESYLTDYAGGFPGEGSTAAAPVGKQRIGRFEIEVEP